MFGLRINWHSVSKTFQVNSFYSSSEYVMLASWIVTVNVFILHYKAACICHLSLSTVKYHIAQPSFGNHGAKSRSSFHAAPGHTVQEQLAWGNQGRKGWLSALKTWWTESRADEYSFQGQWVQKLFGAASSNLGPSFQRFCLALGSVSGFCFLHYLVESLVCRARLSTPALCPTSYCYFALFCLDRRSQ